ncbi:hypothetical protein Pan153_15160 [Gimesia panareensis]|uniref:Uncharacterized protein n=1 Tax=Gimesia panareensis TaxID=2527978 RepID=A0A518FKL2_9PLAN|nr:hypothetical protein [Gimesia panareensis]QDV16882.1 hypothetical protein Pan153_15160 [Gimesia panareensis]
MRQAGVCIISDGICCKLICRLRFKTSQKYLGLFTNKVELDCVDDIFKHSERLKAVIGEYEGDGKPVVADGNSSGGIVDNG